MANQIINVTLRQVHEAIKAKIKEYFPALRTVEYYHENRDMLPTPACLFEMTEFEIDRSQNLDNGQFAVKTRWEAFFLATDKDGAKFTIRELATQFALKAEENRWGLKINPAEIEWAGSDEFNPKYEKYEVWRVDWEQVIFMGHIEPDPVIEYQPYLGFAPNIGADHEDDYIPVNLEGLFNE